LSWLGGDSLIIIDQFKNLFQKNNQKNNSEYTFAQMINGMIPIFSQFGDDVYASDVVQTCIDIVASECSKLRPKHIRTDENDIQTRVLDSLNRLFKFSPNELMTTKDFLEKIVWLLCLNYNAFIYPTYKIIKVSGFSKKIYTGLYPLKPTQVQFLKDPSGKLFIELIFAGGQSYTLPYSKIIHIRKKFSVNEIMGGGYDGNPNNKGILKALEINNTVTEGLEKGVKSSMAINGILNIKTMLDDKKQEVERKRFEKALKDSESGILPMDLKGDYIPIKADPKLVDKETLKFLQEKILPYYGVPLPIYLGDFTDDQYSAFYERTLESIVIGLGQAFSKTLLTEAELEAGHEIVFFQHDMMYLSTKTKLELIKIAGEQGLLRLDDKRKILGYAPIGGEEGNQRTVSLNYISTKLADAYQLKKAGLKGEDHNE
jgi:HK97 family phage portal protein